MDREILALLVRAKDEASDSFNRVERSLKGLHDQADKTGGRMGALGSILQGIGQGIGQGIFDLITDSVGNLAEALGGLVTGSIAKAGEMERFSAQLEVLLGSSEAAEARLRELVEFARSTPFELPGVIEASRTLQVFTQGALATGDGLRMVGDIAAGTGRPFQEVAMWVGRLYDAMQSGRPFGEATMRLQEMGAMSGNSRARIEQLAKAVKDGTMTMADAWDLAQGEFGQFSGLMQKQSGTLEGMLSNLADTVGQKMAGIGEALLPLAKEVIPVIMEMVENAGNAIAGFVRDNYEQIRAWVLGIINFISGLVTGLFGESKAFTAVGESAAAAAPQVNQFAGSTDRAAGSSAKASKAMAEQTERITEQIAAVKELDAAQEKRYTKELARLTGAAQAEINAIDAADRKRAVDEERAGILDDLAKAEAAVAAATDPEQQAAAIERLNDLRARQAEFEQDQADDTRKAQLEGVKDYIAKIEQAETEWTSKKGLLDQMKKNEAVLQSQLAAAAEAGDLQRVADLTLMLEAVKATERRAQAAQANIERTAELEREKERLEDLKKAASGAGAAMGASITAGAVTGGAAIEEMTFLGEANMRRLGSSVTGKGGLTEQLEDARLAGIKFGEDLKVAIGKVVSAIQTVIGWLQRLLEWFEEVQQSEVWKFLTEPIVIDEEKLPNFIVPGKVSEGVKPGLTDVVGEWIGDIFSGGKARGGPVRANRAYMVGEQGPEIHVPDGNGTIVPNGALGGMTVAPGAIVISGVTDPEAVARAVLQALQRERERQGMSLA